MANRTYIQPPWPALSRPSSIFTSVGSSAQAYGRVKNWMGGSGPLMNPMGGSSPPMVRWVRPDGSLHLYTTTMAGLEPAIQYFYFGGEQCAGLWAGQARSALYESGWPGQARPWIWMGGSSPPMVRWVQPDG